MATKQKPVRLPKIDVQLKVLNDYWEAIQKRPRPGYSTSSERLVDQWELLEAGDPSIAASSAADPKLKGSTPFILRGRTFQDRPPLAEFFAYIEGGSYPPPELLLTLLHVWRDYREAGGSMRLEDAFLGQPKPRGANYAARALKQRKDIGARIRLGSEMDKGRTKAEVAEMLALEFGGSEESMKKLKPFRRADLEPEK